MPSPINPYWAAATSLAVWFLFVHSPPVLLERGILERPLFLLHIFGAYVIYLACVHNTGRSAFASRASHVLVGKVGMVCGVVGFFGGLVCVLTTWNELDKGFAIGITIGGILQMKLQYEGYLAIQEYRLAKEQLRDLKVLSAAETSALRERRDNLLLSHIGCMVALFVSACGIPAVMRLVHRLGFHSTGALLVGLGAMEVFKARYQTYMTQHLQRKRKEL